MNRRAHPLFVVVASGLLLFPPGCAGGGGGKQARGRNSGPARMPPPPKSAPAVPARQAVPLDPMLTSSARKEVNEALGSSSPLVRAQALEALRNDPSSAEAAKGVIALLDDPQPGVRFGAAMMAGELKVKDAAAQLRKLAADRDPSVQVAARFALHKLGDTRLTHDLEKFATSDDPRVRRNVALALGMLGEPSGVKILRVMRVDLDPLVRQQALEAMWRLGDDEALKALVALTASGYADDKIIGLLALAAPRRQNVRPHVRGLLAGDDVYTEVALVAARAMGMLGSDEGYTIARDASKSKDPHQRFLAALALGAIGRTDAQDDLRRLLSDPEPNVQLAAASAVLQLKG